MRIILPTKSCCELRLIKKLNYNQNYKVYIYVFKLQN